MVCGDGKTGCKLDLERQRLVEANIGLARYHAEKMKTSRYDFDDLLGAAHLGLCRAAAYWDGNRRFAPYATSAIQTEIREEIRSILSVADVPRRTTQHVMRIIARYGDDWFPSREELKQLLGLRVFPEKRYKQLYSAWLLHTRKRENTADSKAT